MARIKSRRIPTKIMIKFMYEKIDFSRQSFFFLQSKKKTDIKIVKSENCQQIETNTHEGGYSVPFQ